MTAGNNNVPEDVVDTFRKLYAVARENHVPFPQVAEYALGTKDKAPDSKPAASQPAP